MIKNSGTSFKNAFINTCIVFISTCIYNEKKMKNGPNWQKILSHSISQKLYLMWLWFLVHMCKMMISWAIFFQFFKILIFQVFQSSSINAKRKFWGVPHLLHISMIFLKKIFGKLHTAEKVQLSLLIVTVCHVFFQ